jgi:hypothetical protein
MMFAASPFSFNLLTFLFIILFSGDSGTGFS